MAGIEVEAVVIVDQKLYTGTGLVGRWMQGVGNTLWHQTVAAAPQRSGELKTGIGLDFDYDSAGRRVSAEVTSSAPHTMYVLFGTEGIGGYIYSQGGKSNIATIERMLSGQPAGGDTRGMWLAFTRPYPGKRLHLRVRGQRANNFMLAGYNATARRHRALHPMAPGILTF